ncbi:MAG TPA: NAD(P)H-hydrate dehydratase [Verrucomicrobiales bacterium]|nr:NAD(P)H-hydrate dehydratase [Verrucomicrobiales bacterium]
MDGVVLTPAEMRRAEEHVFASGASPEELMEEAGWGLARAIQRFFPEPGRLLLYLGKGHNAGDALAAARHLVPLGWEVTLRWAAPAETCSALTRRKHEQLLEIQGGGKGEGRMPRSASGFSVQLDGLLGIGATGPLSDAYAALAREMNARRQAGRAATVSVDIPSGLDGTSGIPGPGAVEADYTCTVACAKSGLLADRAISHTGRIECIALSRLPGDFEPADAGLRLITPAALLSLLPRRPFDFHKGQAGRVAIAAGSRGLTGAAVLTASGALAAGAGLVTLLVPEEAYSVVASSAPAEVMVRPWNGDAFETLGSFAWDVLAAGPGLGVRIPEGLSAFLEADPRAAVLDADMLNRLAEAGEKIIRRVSDAGPRLLTPHPGEFARLAPDLAAEGKDRRSGVEGFVERYPATLLLKGARTAIGERGQPVSFNSTGDPGMATGGMGDVLTGVLAGLMAQGMPAYDAACAGAWLCGRSAECAMIGGAASRESLRAGNVVEQLGAAFRSLRQEGAALD